MWKPIGSIQLERIRESRLQAHWAAQVLSAVAGATLQTKADDSQSNLGWNPETQSFDTHEIPGGGHLQLVISSLSLRWSISGESFSCPGSTLDEALAWASQNKSVAYTKTPSLRDYDMPSHPVGENSTFPEPDSDALHELANWFHNANALIQPIAKSYEHASPVRCWPHHFDIATLITLDPDKDAESARSIGVGLSPGDAGYEEPYFYVNPWPRGEFSPLPTLPAGGHWHIEGWFGAVLPVSAIRESNAGQAEIEAFLNAAIQQELDWLHR